MALNKTLKDVGLFYEKLGNFNADSLYQNMRKASDYYYIGFLTQVSVDAPTNEILYSDFLQENGITFTYENTGKYRMYCNLFKPGYVEVEVNERQNNAPASSVVLATVYDGYVEFTALDGGGLMDDILYNTPVKVKVWTNPGINTPPVSVVPQSMWYVKFYDTTGTGFSAVTQDWMIEGSILFDSQNVLSAAPYSGNGISNASYNSGDPNCFGCTWRIYTIENIGAFPSITWNGTDGSNVPFTANFIEVTSKKSFTGSTSASVLAYITCSEFSDTVNFPVNLADPFGPSALDAITKYYFGTQASASVVVNGPSDFTVTLSNIYTNGNTIGFYIDKNFTLILNEIL
jgi:hypothetical protein